MSRVCKSIAEATLRRMPSYLRFVSERETEGRETVSCTEIAERFRQDPTQVRKDLHAVGGEGRPRSGFEIKALKRSIESFLGWNNTREAFLVGAGNLGAALVGYEGFEPSGMCIVAVFDNNPAKIGKTVADKPVFDVKRFPALARRMHIQIGVLAVPAREAQGVADMMITSGIRAIWNFAPRKLFAPDGVIIENADLTPSLAMLSAQLRFLLET